MQNSEAEFSIFLIGLIVFYFLQRFYVGPTNMVTRENLSCMPYFELGTSRHYGVKCAFQILALPKKRGGGGVAHSKICWWSREEQVYHRWADCLFFTKKSSPVGEGYKAKAMTEGRKTVP